MLSRIAPQDADDLNELVGPFDARRAAVPGRDVFPPLEGGLAENTALKREDLVCVGVRVAAPPADAAERAVRLAAFAVERDVEIVLLSEVDATGLERFGFRVERVGTESDDPLGRYEDQVRRFWNIDLVL